MLKDSAIMHLGGSSGEKREEHWLWSLLACPWCGGDLRPIPTGALCKGCGEHYQRTHRGNLDLRIKRPKRLETEIELGPQADETLKAPFLKLRRNVEIPNQFKGAPLPKHISREMLSQFPTSGNGGICLDLGCGAGRHRELCERAGFLWVGIDISPSSEAMLLADAHALPFRTEVFDFVLSVAVLEHLTHPTMAMREVRRVLKSRGLVMGTVAFLEPYHSGSHYHHTHLGVLACLKAAGLEAEWISPQPGWEALEAISGQLFPRAPKWLSRLFTGPTRIFHRLWWLAGNILASRGSRLEEQRLFALAGAFVFKASKG